MKIDAGQFALQLISGISPVADETDEVFIKRSLTLYLKAYFLTEDFNRMEAGQFEHMKKRELNELMNQLISARFN